MQCFSQKEQGVQLSYSDSEKGNMKTNLGEHIAVDKSNRHKWLWTEWREANGEK